MGIARITPVVGAVLLMSPSLATWSLSSNRLAGAEDERAADDREVAARVLLELRHARATPSRRIRSTVRISKDAGEEVEEARRRARGGDGSDERAVVRDPHARRGEAGGASTFVRSGRRPPGRRRPSA